MSSSSTTTISSSSSPLTLMGVTGKTGGHAVTHLLSRNDDTIYIRGIVRSEEKGTAWLKKLSEKYGEERIKKFVTYAVADELDTAALTVAFNNSSAVYVFLSPHFPDNAFISTKKKIGAIVDALKSSGTGKERIVALSSIGAHVTTPGGIVTTLHLFEKELNAAFPTSSSSTVLTFIRAGSFYENALRGDIASAKSTGSFPVYYPQPIETKFPDISAKDIGEEVARYLVERSDRSLTKTANPLYVELEGPERYSPLDCAAIYTKAFGHTVTPIAPPPSEWAARISARGIPPEQHAALIDMWQGINDGVLKFEDKPENGTVSVKGKTTLEEGLGELIREFEAASATTQQQQKK